MRRTRHIAPQPQAPLLPWVYIHGSSQEHGDFKTGESFTSSSAACHTFRRTKVWQKCACGSQRVLWRQRAWKRV